MTVAGRLVLGTFVVVLLTIAVLIWGSERTLRTSLETEVRREAVHDSVAALTPSPLDTASEAQIAGTLRQARRALLGASVLALAVALGLAAVAGRTIAGPLASLTAAARDLANGLPPRVPHSGIREIDGLGEALRQMNRQLGDRLAEVQRTQAGSTAIVDAMVEGIIAGDARGRVTLANPAARRLLGYAPDARLPELRTLFRVKTAREAVETVLQGEAVHDREIELDDRILALNARPLADGGAVLVLHDLTDIRRLEAIRRDFVANVSHELKTPLTSIAGYAETLSAGDVPPEIATRFLGTIRANARRMQRLVDDLLDLSRIESGRWVPRRETVALTPLVAETVALLADRAEAKRVRVELAIPAEANTITVDADAVRQVLTNLLDNAIRHVADGGRVGIVARRDGAQVELAVTDNGSGIPGEHLPRIFERFYRADPARSREEGGTGLGLAIVKHLVEAHGGRVTAESLLGRGTTIRSWWPA
ncbi:MAG TPA: ATP-binding protein [Gemmatimonadales bacterium]|nr:ATP-binding protein [Gemmatimonadales bacterium]